MAIKDVILRVKTDTKQAMTGMGKLNSSIMKVGAAMGVAFGGAQLVNYGKEALLLASKVEGVKSAFNKLDKADLLNNLRRATRGTVADFDLMKTAMRASNFKIPLEQLGTLLEFAQKRATQTGESVDYLVNSIVDGIGRKSTLVLDNLGISATELQAEVKKVGDFGIATGNIVERELGKMGDVALTTADKISQISAEFANIKVAIGEMEISVLSGMGAVYKRISGFFDALKKELEKPGGFREEFLYLMGIDPYIQGKPGLQARPDNPSDFGRTTGSKKTIIEETTEKIEDQYEAMGLLTHLYGNYVDTITRSSQLGGTRSSGGLMKGVTQGNKPSPFTLDEREVRTAFAEFDVIANETARTLYQAFSEAWNDIFGEANSLFEKLLQNIATGLMDLAAQNVAQSLFTSLIPGGSLIDSIGGFLGLNKQTTLVQIGDTQLERATTTIVPTSINSLRRRRVPI